MSEDRAKRAGALWFGCAPDEVFAEDLSRSYPWVRVASLYLILDMKKRRLLVATRPEGEPLLFATEPIDAQIPRANALFALEGVDLRTHFAPVELARNARALLKGVGGFVASPAFEAEALPALRYWLKRDGASEETFRRFAADHPARTARGDAWDLRFHYFDPRGGVERWTLSGSAALTAASVETAVPEGSFRFPYG
jgi:hypothetical protein